MIMDMGSKLIGLQMLIDGLNASTIQFYWWSQKSLEHGASCAEMARAAYISPQAANRHVKKLVEKGYIERLGYRLYRKSERGVKDKDLLRIQHVVMGIPTMTQISA